MDLLSFSTYSFDSLPVLKPALVIIFVILGALLLSSIILTVLNIKAKSRSASGKIILMMLYIATIIVLICAVVCYNRYSDLAEDAAIQTTAPSTPATINTQPTTEETTEATP